MAGYEYVSADADQVRAVAGELHEIYRGCFTEPPWSEPATVLDRFPERLAEHSSRPGFRALLATGPGGVAGVVYGWAAPPRLPTGNPFDDAIVAAVTPEMAAELVAPAVTLVEIMVGPRHRRRGVARTLLDGFVAGAPSAWLVTHPDAPARALYESAGWRAQFRYTVVGEPLMLYLWKSDASSGRSG